MKTTIFLYLAALSLAAVRYSSAQSRPVDQTLVSGEVGVDVVEACIRKLSVLHELFENDFGFLKRIALVESDYGRNQSVITPESPGGIWQISSEMQEYIENNNNFLPSLIIANEVGLFGTATHALPAPRVPMWSAFSARLFLKFQVADNASLPRNLNNQADWWSSYYNTNGSRDQFIQEVEAYEETNRCNASMLDLWFLVDHSSSLSQEDFNASLAFVSQLSSRFPISPHQVRTGLMLFSRRVELKSRFKQHESNAAFEAAINGIQIDSHAGTRAGNALEKVFERGFSEQTGARPPSDGVPRILIMLTDGNSQDSVVTPTENLKAAGVTIFAIGVGDGVDDNELNFIASDPDTEYSYRFDDFDNLLSIFGDRLTRLACDVPRIIPNDTTVEVHVFPGFPTYGVVKTSNNGSAGDVHVTLSIRKPGVSGQAYVSSSFPNPNAALHESAIPFQTGSNTATIESSRMRQTNSSQLYISFTSNNSEPFEAEVKIVGEQVDTIAVPKAQPTREPSGTFVSKASSTETLTMSVSPAEVLLTTRIPMEPDVRKTSEATNGYQSVATEAVDDKSTKSTVVAGDTGSTKYVPTSVTTPEFTSNPGNATEEGSGASTIKILSPAFQLLAYAIICVVWFL